MASSRRYGEETGQSSVVVQSDLCSSNQLRAATKPKANASSSVWNDFQSLSTADNETCRHTKRY